MFTLENKKVEVYIRRLVIWNSVNLYGLNALPEGDKGNWIHFIFEEGFLTNVDVLSKVLIKGNFLRIPVRRLESTIKTTAEKVLGNV